MAETATSSPSKSQLTYNRLVVSTGPSILVMAYNGLRPEPELGVIGGVMFRDSDGFVPDRWSSPALGLRPVLECDLLVTVRPGNNMQRYYVEIAIAAAR